MLQVEEVRARPHALPRAGSEADPSAAQLDTEALVHAESHTLRDTATQLWPHIDTSTVREVLSDLKADAIVQSRRHRLLAQADAGASVAFPALLRAGRFLSDRSFGAPSMCAAALQQLGLPPRASLEPSLLCVRRGAAAMTAHLRV